MSIRVAQERRNLMKFLRLTLPSLLIVLFSGWVIWFSWSTMAVQPIALPNYESPLPIPEPTLAAISPEAQIALEYIAKQKQLGVE